MMKIVYETPMTSNNKKKVTNYIVRYLGDYLEVGITTFYITNPNAQVKVDLYRGKVYVSTNDERKDVSR